MQRICCLALLTTFILVVGCTNKPRHVVDDDDKAKEKDVIKVVKDGDVKIPPKDELPPPDVVPELSVTPQTPDEIKETALLEAIDLLVEKKYADAKTALRKAQLALLAALEKDKNDATASRALDVIDREIAKVQGAIDREAAAGQAVEAVKTVLEDGKADEAAKLADQALEQFGGGEQAAELSRLKQQADAVVTASSDDANARFDALKAEATAHFQKKNFRAAAASMEHALAVKPDVVLAERLGEVRNVLATYDDNRALAAGLRRDPTRLEEALTYLRKARDAWDTLEVRQQIDEFTIILERRRDRLAVAAFEVRGDVGLVGAGATIAEELLPHFSPRFDVVERGQLGKVLAELSLEADDLTDNATARKELGRASRVRYLVVGSVTTIGGVTVNARLVETATGLVVQTARVTAPDVETLIEKKLLRRVALMLQMTDRQKMEFLEKQREQASKVVVVKPIESEPLEKFEAVPELPKENVRPVVIVTHTPAPLPLGKVTIDDFHGLRKPPPVTLVIIKDAHRNRLLRLTLELGDNLFRSRHFREAERHYNLALSLAGPRREVVARVENCRRYLPPPPPPRARLAVFGFYSEDGPQLVPAAMGDWAADSLSPYLGRNYELIDRGEVAWYMGRLNVTMRELLTDPSARLALARALNARFFVFGTIKHTASFNVETHLIDVESGARTGTAAIHVKDQLEMNRRMSELAGQMGVKPDEQEKMAAQAKETEKALSSARALLDKDPGRAAVTAQAALKASPNNVALSWVLAEAERRQKLAAFEAERQKEAKARADALDAAKKRQVALVAVAKAAREKAEKDAAARGAEEMAKQQQQRGAAADRLRVQAKQATAKGDHARAVQLLQSAAALSGTEAVYRELGEARAAVEKAKQDSAEAEKQKRDAKLRAEREAALKRIADERLARDKAETDRKKAQEARDQAQHDGLMKQAQTLFKEKKHAEALAAAQSANKTKPGADSAALIHQIQDAIALAEAEKKGDAEKKRLKDEQEKRRLAEVQLKKNQDAYLTALDRGRDLVKKKKYAEAIEQYQAAGKLFATDAARNELTAAKQLLAAEEGEKKKGEQLAALLKDGKAALDGKNHAKAIDLYRQAVKLSPGNAEAKTGLSRAEYERDAEATRLRAFTAQVTTAEKALQQGKKKEAASILCEALKLYPDDKKAKDLLAKAEPVNEDYKLAMDAGSDAMSKGNYQGAINSYRQALVKKPDDPEATKALAEAQRRLKGEQDKKTEAAYQAAMKDAKAAAGAQKWAEAIKAYDAALAQKPKDPAAEAGRKAAQSEVAKLDDAKKMEAAYQAAMKDARAAEGAQKWSEAIKAYDAALAQKPKDPAAEAGKKAAQTELAKLDNAKKKEAAYQAAIKDAKAAAGAQKWAEAVKAYDAALAQKPKDPAAEAGRKAAQSEVAKLENAKKMEAAYQAAMKDARAAEGAQKWAEAIKAYDAALAQKPKDPAAEAGKKAAQTELTKLENAKKMEAAYQAAMKDARAAAGAQKWAEAIKAYDAALAQKPKDPAAEAGRKAAQAELAKLDDAKKKEAAYQAAMKDAKAAEGAKKWAEAVKAYDAALAQKPKDPAAEAGRKAAQAELNKIEENNRKETAYQAAMKQAKAAFDGKKYADAVKSYDAALAQKPNDQAALAGKKAALDAQKPKTDPKEEDYKLAMSAGQAAMKKGNYQGAINSFNEALRLKKDDAAAKAALAEAQKLLKAEQDKQKEAAYKAAMTKAKAAFDAKKYDDAFKAYDEALQNKPGDKAAIDGKKAAEAQKQPKPDAKAELAKAMQQGAALEKQKKYADAAAAYTKAVKWAADLGGKTELAQAYLGVARNEHAQKNFAEAIKAYDEVLKRDPNNAEAKAGLTKAKANKQ